MSIWFRLSVRIRSTAENRRTSARLRSGSARRIHSTSQHEIITRGAPAYGGTSRRVSCAASAVTGSSKPRTSSAFRTPGTALRGTFVVDQSKTIGALVIAVAQDLGIDVAYLPGLTMRRVADSHEGQATCKRC